MHYNYIIDLSASCRVDLLLWWYR